LVDFMDKTTFASWFRKNATKLDVGDVGFRWMDRREYGYGELGNYNPNRNVISIDERVLVNDKDAINVGLHELAHALAMKRTPSFRRVGDNLVYNLNDSFARGKLLDFENTGGHTDGWLAVSQRLGVDVKKYVDRHPPAPLQQARLALGLRFKRRG
jgi:hypothetical protein